MGPTFEIKVNNVGVYIGCTRMIGLEAWKERRGKESLRVPTGFPSLLSYTSRHPFSLIMDSVCNLFCFQILCVFVSGFVFFFN